jgi:hypothetical protein
MCALTTLWKLLLVCLGWQCYSDGGVQAASRPRTGLSPPEQIIRLSDVIAESP